MWVLKRPALFALTTGALCLLTLLALLSGSLIAAETGGSIMRTDPVIVRSLFSGAPVDQICAYKYTGSQYELIPLQIDERDGNSAYVSSEDGVLDGNDEIVFMAADLGEIANVSIAASLNISPVWYRIEVDDPLSAGKGWAYLVRSSTIDCTPPRDYAQYDGAGRQIVARDYSVGWATSHSGLDRMTLFGGADILDRTKLRARTSLGPVITEDSQIFKPTPALELIKDGPVRVIVKRGAADTIAYASMYQQTTPVPLNLVPGSTAVDEIRISFDLSSGTNGTYFDENTAAGVAINGVPDSVPATPLNAAWRQTSLASGTIVEVVELSQITGTPQHFYMDQANCGAADTGDDQCWGDSGYAVLNPAKTSVTITGTRYIQAGSAPNVGATYSPYPANPLTATAHQESIFSSSLYLPSLAR